MTAHFKIRPERDAYAPGDEVRGTLEVLESLSARALKVSLDYRDWTADYHATGRSIAVDTPLHEGNLEQGSSFTFSVVLPADALPNQQGTFGSTSWVLRAHVDRRGLDIDAWQPLGVPAPVRASQAP